MGVTTGFFSEGHVCRAWTTAPFR